ncbi:MAG: GNAT family N-acetyltransferase [Acetatifactor sp.]|nr:GNAT family N-acetyltransferase [Acetatifactor sp.]
MIKRANQKDLQRLAELAAQLWTEHSVRELEEDLADIMAKEDACFFLKYDKEFPVGFAQCQLRHDYVEGTDSSPVGYLEGIFVQEECRHRGYAGELLQECENWAREKGCEEFASDCELVNKESMSFHLSVGFHEANRIICFTKKL